MMGNESHGTGLYGAAPVLTDFICVLKPCMSLKIIERQQCFSHLIKNKQTTKCVDEAALSSEGVLGMGWGSKATSQARIHKSW